MSFTGTLCLTPHDGADRWSECSYDIQISPQYHRVGIGRKLIDNICTIGQAFGMAKLVITVLKGKQ